jgi:hypothetical protein
LLHWAYIGNKIWAKVNLERKYDLGQWGNRFDQFYVRLHERWGLTSSLYVGYKRPYK